MRRLLQFGTLMLFLAALVTPLMEIFDRWDPPGISNDTEFAVFLLILGLTLVLVVSRLLAALALILTLVTRPHPLEGESALVAHSSCFACLFIPPRSPLPLRI